MAAFVAIERTDAHESVDAAFGLQVAVGVFAGDLEGGPLDAGFVAGLDVEDFGFHAVLLDPALIHAHEHVGPIAGFGAASATVDGEVGIAAVELPAEEAADFELIEDLSEVMEFFDHFVFGLGAGVSGGFLGGHLVEDGEVADAGF